MAASEAADHSRVFAEVGDPSLLSRFRFIFPAHTEVAEGDKVDIAIRNIRVAKSGTLMFEGVIQSRKSAEAPKA